MYPHPSHHCDAPPAEHDHELRVRFPFTKAKKSEKLERIEALERNLSDAIARFDREIQEIGGNERQTRVAVNGLIDRINAMERRFDPMAGAQLATLGLGSLEKGEFSLPHVPFFNTKKSEKVRRIEELEAKLGEIERIQAGQTAFATSQKQTNLQTAMKIRKQKAHTEARAEALEDCCEKLTEQVEGLKDKNRESSLLFFAYRRSGDELVNKHNELVRSVVSIGTAVQHYGSRLNKLDAFVRKDGNFRDSRESLYIEPPPDDSDAQPSWRFHDFDQKNKMPPIEEVDARLKSRPLFTHPPALSAVQPSHPL